MLFVSVMFFTLGTLLCAPVARGFSVFFIGRSLQGIGGGGIITMGQVIFADIIPLRQRPKYFSFVLAAWALGSVFGPFEWRSAQAIVPITVGIAGVIIAVVWEFYGAREPVLRQSLFDSPSALATYTCALSQGFILFCALYYVPFFFTAMKFHSPTRSGVDIFPVTCFLLPGSIITSLITTWTGGYRWSIWSGWVITTVGYGLLLLLDQETETAAWASILAVFGIGNGMLLTGVNVGVQAASRIEDAGRAAAILDKC
ncbi:hypothetical protein NEMBOFW57_009492 [Staphylotrichum longicolle]|uniref:Major facilitator superfamily (MFS) profile domain-containing protein n=1 Tax=Staphylotrichum longicolle TaxID=669026 RepID=A0AAD4EP52_9PEZI|nr:hypothetical protein NEMBOFW57_009492 [Staphylotrichum longicolle]